MPVATPRTVPVPLSPALTCQGRNIAAPATATHTWAIHLRATLTTSG